MQDRNVQKTALASIRRIIGKKSRNMLLGLAVAGVSCGTIKHINDKQVAENERIENIKHTKTKKVDVFSCPSDLSIQEFEQKLSLGGYSIKRSVSYDFGTPCSNVHPFSNVYQDIYDSEGNNVGAYVALWDNKRGIYLQKKDGKSLFQVNSNDEKLGKILQDMGFNKNESIEYTADDRKSHATLMYEADQERLRRLAKHSEMVRKGYTF